MLVEIYSILKIYIVPADICFDLFTGVVDDDQKKRMISRYADTDSEEEWGAF